MDDSDDPAFKNPECNKTIFPIIVSVIFHSEGVMIKYGRRINKVYSVLFDIGFPFCFIPFKIHDNIVTTI